MLARGRRALDLRFVLTVRRGKHHGIDLGIGQNGLEVVDQAHALVRAEVLRLGARARVAGDEADVVAPVVDGRDERASPAS